MTRCLRLGDMEAATEQKRRLEEKQRAEERKRENLRAPWRPKYFIQEVTRRWGGRAVPSPPWDWRGGLGLAAAVGALSAGRSQVSIRGVPLPVGRRARGRGPGHVALHRGRRLLLCLL